MIDLLIHVSLLFIALFGAIIAGSLAYGFVSTTFVRRQPLKVTTNTIRRLRWLVAELQKEIDKATGAEP